MHALTIQDIYQTLLDTSYTYEEEVVDGQTVTRRCFRTTGNILKGETKDFEDVDEDTEVISFPNVYNVSTINGWNKFSRMVSAGKLGRRDTVINLVSKLPEKNYSGDGVLNSVGTSEKPFHAIFNGNKFLITITPTHVEGQDFVTTGSLFGKTSGAKISDVYTLFNGNETHVAPDAEGNFGIICNYATNNTRFSNCYVTSQKTNQAYNPTLVVNSTIGVTSYNVGFAVGKLDNSSITLSAVTVDNDFSTIALNLDKQTYFGGLIGYCNSSSVTTSFTNFDTAVDVIGNYVSEYSVGDNSHFGGLCGTVINSTIKNVYSINTIRQSTTDNNITNLYVGGLFGDMTNTRLGYAYFATHWSYYGYIPINMCTFGAISSTYNNDSFTQVYYERRDVYVYDSDRNVTSTTPQGAVTEDNFWPNIRKIQINGLKKEVKLVDSNTVDGGNVYATDDANAPANAILFYIAAQGENLNYNNDENVHWTNDANKQTQLAYIEELPIKVTVMINAHDLEGMLPAFIEEVGISSQEDLIAAIGYINNGNLYTCQVDENGNVTQSTLMFTTNVSADFSGNYAPIGTYEHPFNGIISGNNNSATLDATVGGVLYVGLLGVVGPYGEVKNLGIKGVINKTTGGTCFHGSVCAVNFGYIHDCFFVGGLTRGTQNATDFNCNPDICAVGGICAINNGIIERCAYMTTTAYTMTINAMQRAVYSGGIAAINHGEINNCYTVIQNIDGKSSNKTTNKGGIVGYTSNALVDAASNTHNLNQYTYTYNGTINTVTITNDNDIACALTTVIDTSDNNKVVNPYAERITGHTYVTISREKYELEYSYRTPTVSNCYTLIHNYSATTNTSNNYLGLAIGYKIGTNVTNIYACWLGSTTRKAMINTDSGGETTNANNDIYSSSNTNGNVFTNESDFINQSTNIISKFHSGVSTDEQPWGINNEYTNFTNSLYEPYLLFMPSVKEIIVS